MVRPNGSTRAPWKELTTMTPRRIAFVLTGLPLVSVLLTVREARGAEPSSSKPAAASIAYRTVKIDGLEIFYREAGPKNAPVVLLLHGFPTSSHMFRNLIPALAGEFHLVAPDYPGFGNSSMPTVDRFDYTFDNLANV